MFQAHRTFHHILIMWLSCSYLENHLYFSVFVEHCLEVTNSSITLSLKPFLVSPASLFKASLVPHVLLYWTYTLFSCTTHIHNTMLTIPSLSFFQVKQEVRTLLKYSNCRILVDVYVFSKSFCICTSIVFLLADHLY